VVLVEIHPAFHASTGWALTSVCESGAASDSEARTSSSVEMEKTEIWLIAYSFVPNKRQAQALSMIEWLFF
jgi:hypothetical protein